MKASTKALALSAVVFLAACGGGGSDEPSATAPATPLAQSNYGDVVATAMASVGGVDALNTALPLAASTTGAAGRFEALGSGDAGAIARFAVRQVTQGKTARARAAAVSQATEACDGGGTLTSAFNDADNNQALSAGDVVTITADNCVAEFGQSAFNGQLSLRVNSISLTNAGEVAAISVSVTISNFSSAGTQINGAMDISVDSQFETLQYRNLVGTSAGTQVTFDFTQRTSAANGGVTVNGNLGINGSSYLLSTPVTLMPGAIGFSSGTLRVADRSGGYTDVVMSSTGYTAYLYLPGDALVDARTTVFWSAR